jgi:xylulokinase
VSLLGIDVGTTGCKAAVFRDDGEQLAYAYAEYPLTTPAPGQAELDPHEVWAKVQDVIRRVVAHAPDDPVAALSVSSLGEAFVPVSEDRQILGPSIINFDARGREYVPELEAAFSAEEFYRITGHTVANVFGLPKLMWIQRNQPELFERTHRFLPWTSFVTFMLGADPIVDYSLAGRMLGFDVERGCWSRAVFDQAGIDVAKLPATAPASTVIGVVSKSAAQQLGLPPGTAITAGCHDQCATAVGCGAIEDGQAACGMGTYLCITPVFSRRRDVGAMMRLGLNTEHHPAPGKFVSLIYNQGGALLRWYRDTFAPSEHRQAMQEERDVYEELLAEMPAGPSPVIVLPHFFATGPPEFISDSSGVMVGLKLETKRGDIVKALLEATMFYMCECVEQLPATGIEISQFRAAGGGSRSDAWLQIAADIMARPFTRMKLSEAGILGAAVIAGVGHGTFTSFPDGVRAMVKTGKTFEPQSDRAQRYDARFAHYRRLWPLMREYLKALSRAQRPGD